MMKNLGLIYMFLHIFFLSTEKWKGYRRYQVVFIQWIIICQSQVVIMMFL